MEMRQRLRDFGASVSPAIELAPIHATVDQAAASGAEERVLLPVEGSGRIGTEPSSAPYEVEAALPLTSEDLLACARDVYRATMENLGLSVRQLLLGPPERNEPKEMMALLRAATSFDHFATLLWGRFDAVVTERAQTHRQQVTETIDALGKPNTRQRKGAIEKARTTIHLLLKVDLKHLSRDEHRWKARRRSRT
jgi:hypothetical protein